MEIEEVGRDLVDQGPLFRRLTQPERPVGGACTEHPAAPSREDAHGGVFTCHHSVINFLWKDGPRDEGERRISVRVNKAEIAVSVYRVELGVSGVLFVEEEERLAVECQGDDRLPVGAPIEMCLQQGGVS